MQYFCVSGRLLEIAKLAVLFFYGFFVGGRSLMNCDSGGTRQISPNASAVVQS